MKLFPKLSLFALVAALFLSFAACSPDDDGGDKNKPDPDKIKADENRALYNQILLGEWIEAEYHDGGMYTEKQNGVNIEFKANEMILPKGKWDSNAYSDQTMTFPIKNFATLFKYTRTYTGKTYTTLENENVNGTNYLMGGINLEFENGDYAIYSLFCHSNRTTIDLCQTKVKNGSHTGTVSNLSSESYYIKKTNSGNNSGDDIDIKGSYSFAQGNYTHSLTFNANGSWQFISGSRQSSQNKTGSWSTNGSTLTMSISSPAAVSENFSVSSNNSSCTLTLQGGGSVSQILSIFGVISNTLTMSKN
jgi:hypothetical protein